MYSDWHVYNHQTNKGEAIETGLPRGGSTPPFFDGKRRREAQANQSRTQEPLLAFFSSTEGVTCERKARTLKLRVVLTVMPQPLLAICAVGGSSGVRRAVPSP